MSGQAIEKISVPWIVPITCAILFALFLVQRHGTARVGTAFGPIMFVWFATLAVLGVWHVAKYPSVLAALSKGERDEQ